MQISEKLSNETAHEYALRVIKENIISLELAPGAPISENELSDQMGISRTPIRQALQELAKVKIVEIVPQKRSMVSLIDYSLVEEAQFMRYHLESAVTAQACEQCTEEDLISLGENITLQKYFLENKMYVRLHEKDDAFHQHFYEIARKTEIFELMKMLSIHFDRVRFLSIETLTYPEIVEEHEELLECIRQRASAKATALLQKHLNRYKADAVALREKHPEYFK